MTDTAAIRQSGRPKPFAQPRRSDLAFASRSPITAVAIAFADKEWPAYRYHASSTKQTSSSGVVHADTVEAAVLDVILQVLARHSGHGQGAGHGHRRDRLHHGGLHRRHRHRRYRPPAERPTRGEIMSDEHSAAKMAAGAAAVSAAFFAVGTPSDPNAPRLANARRLGTVPQAPDPCGAVRRPASPTRPTSLHNWTDGARVAASGHSRSSWASSGTATSCWPCMPC